MGRVSLMSLCYDHQHICATVMVYIFSGTYIVASHGNVTVYVPEMGIAARYICTSWKKNDKFTTISNYTLQLYLTGIAAFSKITGR